MKSCLLIFFLFYSVLSNAQQNTSSILKQPANWEFERFPLPPAFAPAITDNGFEELRFAPGMFKKEASDYFSYVFVAALNRAEPVSRAYIESYLEHYYKGLCAVTAKDQKLAIDTAAIYVSLHGKQRAKNGKTYQARVHVFGVFTDGAPLDLYMEITTIYRHNPDKVYLLFLASPRKKKEEIWKQLYQAREQALAVIEK